MPLSTGLAILAALGEAFCAALAGTLQHTAASRGRTAAGTATGHLGRFLRHQLTQPLWYAALGVQAGSLVMHATALQLGSLSLVQPVLAIVVVLALPLNHHMNHSRITRVELRWAGMVTLSLACFLVVAAPHAHTGPPAPDQLVLPGAAAVLVIACCVLVARWVPSRAAAVALGSAAGLSFSLEAVLLQTTTDRLLDAPLSALSSPGPYALALAGIAGIGFTQLSYRAGPISAALPAIITVNPVASVVLGVVSGSDQIRLSAPALAVESVSFVCLAVSVAALSRISAPSPQYAHRPSLRRRVSRGRTPRAPVQRSVDRPRRRW